jgi:Rieske Fe-S protein
VSDDFSPSGCADSRDRARTPQGPGADEIVNASDGVSGPDDCAVSVPEGSTCQLETTRRLHPLAMPRRDFLVWVAAASLGATAAFMGATVVQAVMPPPRSIEGKTKVGKLAVAKVSDLRTEEPVLVDYGDDLLFVAKTAQDKIVVFDAACPHVRCKLYWNDKTKQFDCPCHASSFSITGQKLGGPAPRGMIPAVFVVQNGEVIVSGFQS